MADHSGKPTGSTLLLDEYFAAGDDAFLGQLAGISETRKLASFADRWKNDPRPWARAKIFDYLAGPLSSPGHNVVVKRLFKHAEKQGDSTLMGTFLHAFDCLVRGQRRMKWRWDSATRQSWQEEELYAPKDNLRAVLVESRASLHDKAPQQAYRIGRIPKNGRLFSYRTRYYLRRRACRYFRFLGYRSPDAYPAAVAAAFARYTDADLAKGEHILDSWCLLNLGFRKHPALTFTPSHVLLNEGHTLNEFTPSPKHAKLWATPAGAEALWNLVVAAQSRFVRLLAMQLLKSQHQSFLATLSAEKLFPLFESSDSNVQQFAAQVFEQLPGLASMSVKVWLQLLATHDPSALSIICSQMLRHVTPERLDLSELISLANSKAAPVSNLGLTFLRTRPMNTPAARVALSELANARCAATAAASTQFALSILGAKENYDVALVSRFFDAILAPTRTAAWAWLAPGSAGYDDPALWSRLLETPYEETRLRLVKTLQARQALPGASVDSLTPIWTTVLLGIHRGGRHKIMALHQISRAVQEQAERAAELLPVMAVAIRSVRPAEARVGLAAVVGAIDRNPALVDAAAKAIPELHLLSAGATA